MYLCSNTSDLVFTLEIPTITANILERNFMDEFLSVRKNSPLLILGIGSPNLKQEIKLDTV